jgi:excisionase family DNA binding protein
VTPHLPPTLRACFSPAVISDMEAWIRKVIDEQVRSHALDPPRYITPKHAARWLDCDVRRIYDLLSQRRLTKHREGGRVLLLRDEVASLVEREGDDDW